jgi:hypothetical protein
MSAIRSSHGLKAGPNPFPARTMRGWGCTPDAIHAMDKYLDDLICRS